MDLFPGQSDFVREQDLVEFVSRDFAFLKDIALQKWPVDVFPLNAELMAHVRVECYGSLVVHLVHSDRGLGFGLTQARNVALLVLSRLTQLVFLTRSLLHLWPILLHSLLHNLNRLESSIWRLILVQYVWLEEYFAIEVAIEATSLWNWFV